MMKFQLFILLPNDHIFANNVLFSIMLQVLVNKMFQKL